MNEATVIVHWPGKDVPACAEHALKLKRMAETLGFGLSITLVDFSLGNMPLCTNCENEKAKAEAGK